MPFALDPTLQVPALFGIAIGIGILARGMRGHILGTRIADTATSTISAIAIGEVQIHGQVEPAELLLTSPLQNMPCVYYRARIRQGGDDGDDTVFREERSVGFRVRDASGALRVFPRGARWDVPERFAGSTGPLGDSPPGLLLRTGPTLAPAAPSHEELVAQLLTVHPVDGVPGGTLDAAGGFPGFPSGSRRYDEARLEPGDEVTILGRVLPFGELEDPTGADLDDVMEGPSAALADPEVAADIAAARAAGLLAGSPEEAWGNAAIPGFGIGKPVRAPELDPAAQPMPIAGQDERASYERTFDLAPGSLVLAASAEVPLVVAAGPPGLAVARQQDRLVVGLLGALLAIGSVVVLAASLSGMIGS